VRFCYSFIRLSILGEVNPETNDFAQNATFMAIADNPKSPDAEWYRL